MDIPTPARAPTPQFLDPPQLQTLCNWLALFALLALGIVWG